MSFADDNPDDQSLTIIYDDVKTGIEALKDALTKEGFPPDGDPKIVK